MTPKKQKEEAVPHEAASSLESESPNNALVKTEIEPMTVAPQQLRDRMKLESERRKVLTDYVSANMVEGKDYGKIEFKTRNGGTGSSKPTLFKPGAEKFCSLFGLQATFNKDFETWEMLGSKSGVVSYVCLLKTKSGSIVGEGRGVADIMEKQGWTANNCVKIAEKRAQIDAVLRSGGLSDFFSQDLEDQPDKEYHERKASSFNGGGKITEAQMRLLFGIMKKAGVEKAKFEQWLLSKHNTIGIENLSKQKASELLDGLIKKYGYPKGAETPQAHEEIPTINLDEAAEESEEKVVEESLSGL